MCYQSIQAKNRVRWAGFAVLLIAVFFSLAACSLDLDSLIPGFGSKDSDNGKDNNTVSKPAGLSETASYKEVVDKLDEIVEYCDDHPSVSNAVIKVFIKEYKDNLPPASAISQDEWNLMAKDAIPEINQYIAKL